MSLRKGILLLCLGVLATGSYATDEVRQDCDVAKDIKTVYWGTAECGFYSHTIAESNARLIDWLYLPYGLPDHPHRCTAYLPDSKQICDVPYEPYVDGLFMYEFGTCSGGIRDGYLTWSVDSGATKFQIQEKVGSSWYTILDGYDVSTPFSRTGGTYNLRIRGYNAYEPDSKNGYGTWRYKTVSLPTCNTTRPVHPH